jgi:hypothetical protein
MERAANTGSVQLKGAPHLLPAPLIGEGDEDVAGRLEGADDVILDRNSRNQSGI